MTAVTLTGKRYLVTGAAGFIGSHICDEILRQGKELVALDIVGDPNAKKRGYNIIHAVDITNPDIGQYFDGVDVVFHQACKKCTQCRENPFRDLIVNAWGSFTVFEQSGLNKVKKVVHAATGSINGGAPKSFYGVSKMAGEAYLRAFSEYHPEFKWTSLRYHHVIGPRQDASDKGGVVPIFIRQALAGGPITVDGDGLQRRMFTSVHDVVQANLLCAEVDWTDNQVFNVMSDLSISILDLAHMVSDLAGGDIPIVHRLPKPGDIREFVTDNNDLKFMGLDYDNDFPQMLETIFEWYRLNGFTRA